MKKKNIRARSNVKKGILKKGTASHSPAGDSRRTGGKGTATARETAIASKPRPRAASRSDVIRLLRAGNVFVPDSPADCRQVMKVKKAQGQEVDAPDIAARDLSRFTQTAGQLGFDVKTPPRPRVASRSGDTLRNVLQ